MGTAVAEKLYSIKRKADNKGIQRYKVVLSVLSFVIIIAFFVLICLAILNENKEFEYSAYGLIVAGLVIIGMLTAYEALRNGKSDVFRFKEVLKDEMDQLCDRHVSKATSNLDIILVLIRGELDALDLVARCLGRVTDSLRFLVYRIVGP